VFSVTKFVGEAHGKSSIAAAMEHLANREQIMYVGFLLAAAARKSAEAGRVGGIMG
jgi:hypothetical protein